MSVSHCMHHALRIAKRPVASWPAEIDRVPAQCAHDDCGEPRCCRQRVSDYLSLQKRMISRRKPKGRGR